MSGGRACVVAILMVAPALATPAPALGHGLSGRADLPMPTWLFAWVATVVLVVSFLALGVLWREPVLEGAPERALVRMPAWIGVLAGALGVGVFAAVIWAGLAGTDVPTDNLAPTVVYVVFWVGLTFASALFGDVFRALNPWRAVARAFGWGLRRTGARAVHPPLGYPSRLGLWPAALGLLAFAWVELVYSERDDPRAIAFLALAFAAMQLIGMALVGVEAWTSRADPFSVYFGLVARIAPLAVREGVLIARRPLAGLTRMAPVPGTVALLSIAIGATTFDGAENSTLWLDLGPRLIRAAEGLGLSESTAAEVAGTIGLLSSIALIGVVYLAGAAGMRHATGTRTRDLPARFAHTLVPIAVGYAAAHYFSLLVFQGQGVAALASDPLGSGANLFGTAGVRIDYTLMSAATIWYVQVAVLLAGHVGGLALGHDRALATWSRPEQAIRSQYWMLSLMVAFTCLGLWLLSSVGAA